MYKGDDFKEAGKIYKNVFRLVKKSQIKWIDKTFVGFTGEMEKPAETLRFTVSTLNFTLEDKRYKNFQADVEMISNYSGWEVHLNLQQNILTTLLTRDVSHCTLLHTLTM